MVEGTPRKSDDDFSDAIELRDTEEELEVFSFNLENADRYFCGSTIVNDRWMIAAAHCYDDFQNHQNNKPREVRTSNVERES